MNKEKEVAAHQAKGLVEAIAALHRRFGNQSVLVWHIGPRRMPDPEKVDVREVYGALVLIAFGKGVFDLSAKGRSSHTADKILARMGDKGTADDVGQRQFICLPVTAVVANGFESQIQPDRKPEGNGGRRNHGHEEFAAELVVLFVEGLVGPPRDARLGGEAAAKIDAEKLRHRVQRIGPLGKRDPQHRESLPSGLVDECMFAAVPPHEELVLQGFGFFVPGRGALETLVE